MTVDPLSRVVCVLLDEEQGGAARPDSPGQHPAASVRVSAQVREIDAGESRSFHDRVSPSHVFVLWGDHRGERSAVRRVLREQHALLPVLRVFPASVFAEWS